MAFLSTSLFMFLSCLRIFSSLYNIISDCDETFNYWEPLHYMLFSNGFQTWEYSPVHAIRSYLYIVLHAIPLYPLRYYISKVALFYLLRVIFAVFSILVESYFINSVRRKFSTSLSHVLSFVLAVNTGMFISTTAFLPSSFALQFVTLGYAAWWNKNLKLSVFCVAISALIGWPFSAALGFPIAVDIIFTQRRFGLFTTTSMVSLFLIGSALIAVDSYYFGRLVFAPLNIVLYNIFSKSGPTLYGTEPITYYLMNLFLNFNIVFVFSILYLPIVSLTELLKIKRLSILTKNFKTLLLAFTGPCIWLLIFFSQPHKEERFLFPIYPLLCLYGSVVIHYLANIFRNTRARQAITAVSLITYCLLSFSRTSILITGYRAPIILYSQIHYSFVNLPVSNRVLCVGKEWYRFPSNFFLPTDRIKLGLIKSEFRGQLPQTFLSDSRRVPEHMNDLNLEEVSSYTAFNTCDYIIDLYTGRNSLLEPDYINITDYWKLVASHPFIDKYSSHRIFRAFYIPFFTSSEKYVSYNQYYLVARVHTKR